MAARPSNSSRPAEEELLRDQAEAVRLAYVAATRARDLLVVPVCGDQTACWLAGGPQSCALSSRRRERPVRTRSRERPASARRALSTGAAKGVAPAGGCVRPGLHKPRVGTHTVAWWDPNVLALDVEENVGVRQQRILEADESGTEVARGEQAYTQWKEGRSAAVAQAASPSIKVQTATAFAAGAGLSELDLARVQIEMVSRVGVERPGGRRFGALVHAVLATVDLDASPDEIGAVAQANAKAYRCDRRGD